MKTKKGLALVITNTKYIQQKQLLSCKKDGQDMKGVLEYLNFDIKYGTDLNRSDMYNIISEFLKCAELYSTILVYYAGHGVQIDGENYFVPVDCEYKPSKSIFVETQLVGINALTEYMTKNPNKTNIMILDACRSNPGFSRDIVGNGLAEVKAGSGTIIAFATSPNKPAGGAADENGNGFYTQCLLSNIVHPNMKIEDMFKAVRNDVIKLTLGEQIPWENTSLNTDFYFNSMTQDEIDEQIYQCVRNNYSAEMIIVLNKTTGYCISDIMRIYMNQKSEKPGGIYFSKKEEFEQFILEQVLEMGFVFVNYRWEYKQIPVIMGEFLHNPEKEIRTS